MLSQSVSQSAEYVITPRTQEHKCLEPVRRRVFVVTRQARSNNIAVMPTLRLAPPFGLLDHR